MTFRRRLAVIALCASGFIGVSGAFGSPQSRSGDHSVVLVNRTDGRVLERAGFSTQRELGDTVDNGNAAAAVSADCHECRTVAVAVQVVLVEGNPHTVTPTNAAIALNQSCVRCESMAAAYQYVVTTNGIVRFTPEGHSAMADLRAQISGVTESGLPFPELDARLSVLVQQLWTVVDEEMRRVGAPFDTFPKKDVDIDTTSDEGLSSLSPTASPSPSQTTTASLEPTATPSPTATESDIAITPSPCPSIDPTAPADDQSPSPSSEQCIETSATSAGGSPSPEATPSESPESSPSPSSESSPPPSPDNTASEEPGSSSPSP